MKKIFTLLAVSVFLSACATTETSNNEVVEPIDTTAQEGKCDLGRKSGGITMATRTECQNLGGRFLK